MTMKIKIMLAALLGGAAFGLLAVILIKAVDLDRCLSGHDIDAAIAKHFHEDRP